MRKKQPTKDNREFYLNHISKPKDSSAGQQEAHSAVIRAPAQRLKNQQQSSNPNQNYLDTKTFLT